MGTTSYKPAFSNPYNPYDDLPPQDYFDFLALNKIPRTEWYWDITYERYLEHCGCFEINEDDDCDYSDYFTGYEYQIINGNHSPHYKINVRARRMDPTWEQPVKTAFIKAQHDKLPF